MGQGEFLFHKAFYRLDRLVVAYEAKHVYINVGLMLFYP